MLHKIRGIQRLDDTIRQSGGRGDNWHMTWAKNGSQYVGLCDGEGWPEIVGWQQVEYNSRVFELQGGTDHPVFKQLPGFPDLFNEWGTPRSCRYYGFGILAIEDRIYHYMSTPNIHFHAPEPRFIGAKLVYSPDLGNTWLNQDGSELIWEEWDDRSHDNMPFFYEKNDGFSLITMLQMGQNYELNQDGYVYLYSPIGGTLDTMHKLALCRIPKDAVLNRAAYEFFVSRKDDGSAEWSSEIAAAQPIHEFPTGWTNTKIHPYAWHPSVIYNAPLGVYLMANWGMGCADDGMWFGKPSYLGFWIAEQPWGPWKQIHEDTSWTPGGIETARAYQPQISPAWLSEDGKTITIAWTDFSVVDDKQSYYCFNWQQALILTD